MVFYCPNAGEKWEDGRYMEIIMHRLLFFGLEVAILGEFGSQYPVFNTIVLDENTLEVETWRQWIEHLEHPTKDHPKGIKSKNYTNIYHFIFDSVEFRGRAFFREQNGFQDGFQVMCRDFDVVDVTHQMPANSPRYRLPIIESE